MLAQGCFNMFKLNKEFRFVIVIRFVVKSIFVYNSITEIQSNRLAIQVYELNGRYLDENKVKGTYGILWKSVLSLCDQVTQNGGLKI